MRVASNKLKDILTFFHTELHGVYEASEIEALIDLSTEHYLGYSKTERLLKEQENLNQSDLLKLYDCAKALKQNIPIQYILHEAWFYNLKFYVAPGVLIPRPETEELVDLIIKENTSAHSFFDLGTGSGCLPVTIKQALHNATVMACDISDTALDIARTNAGSHAAEVLFFKADMLDVAALQGQLPQKFDVIVSNPPYIKASEKGAMEEHVINQEPHLALFVEGDDAIVFYKRCIDLCKQSLNANGTLYFELNPLTSNDVKEYAIESGLFKTVELIKDMSGNMRFLRATKL